MIQLTTDFYNKAVAAIDTKYFPEVKYYRDNDRCAAIHQNTELFSNGCLPYSKYISRIALLCNESEGVIESIIEPFIIPFAAETE